MIEEKPKTSEEKQPADTVPRKPESHIVDITDQFLGKSLIITGAKKP